MQLADCDTQKITLFVSGSEPSDWCTGPVSIIFTTAQWQPDNLHPDVNSSVVTILRQSLTCLTSSASASSL
jgi:hypothetical protein